MKDIPARTTSRLPALAAVAALIAPPPVLPALTALPALATLAALTALLTQKNLPVAGLAARLSHRTRTRLIETRQASEMLQTAAHIIQKRSAPHRNSTHGKGRNGTTI
jgi:hypothetical protein